MKKRIIIFSLIAVTVSLAAFSFINRDYKVLANTKELNKYLPNTPVLVKDKKPLDFFFFFRLSF